ncbi:MAG TPA: PilZ domain-containing protein [Croceibacterium sp.]|nr:PilZ domain-containing protein [Croceibacterium sp.]
MTVLTIRAHRRYAVRQPVRLRKAGGRPASGLMIELSSEGIRISNLGRGEYSVGESVTVEIDELSFGGRIRWAHDGIAGVRLDTALFASQVSDLIARGRGQDEFVRYGT